MANVDAERDYFLDTPSTSTTPSVSQTTATDNVATTGSDKVSTARL